MTENSYQLTSSSISDRGLSEKRPQNEDSYLEMPGSGLFAVADGVGGAQAGDVASQMAVEILGEAFANLRPASDIEEAMQVAISRANEAIYQMSHDLAQLSTMATTIVALHIKGNVATIGHVGDSRLYRLDSKGNLFRETQDHSVVEEEVRAGRMTVEQAAHHPSKNVISRALGAESTVEIDMKTMMIEPNTTFLLCSDGVTRHIPDEELEDLIALAESPTALCGQIKDVCYTRGAEDNLTAVIVKVGHTEEAMQGTATTEENTVASARPPLVNSGIFANSQHDTEEIPTQNLRMPASAMTSAYTADDLQEVSHISIPANPNAEQAAEYDSFTVNKDERTLTISEQGEGSFFGKATYALLLLLTGLALGIVGTYLYGKYIAPPEPPAPILSEMQTKDIPFSAFEENRRNVDKNPEQYIKTVAGAADDAEDFYLLGRAYLLTGQYKESQDHFEKAKQMVSKVTGPDKEMLSNEIKIGLAVVDNTFGRKSLSDSMSKSPEKAGSSNSNTNK